MRRRMRSGVASPDRVGAARWVVTGLTTCVALWGCASGAGGARPVDAAEARRALVVALGAWQGGKSITALGSESPPIVAQDLDWESGAALVRFDLLDNGSDQALNLRVPVELSLRERDGRVVKKRVKYMIGTSPVLTVFREIP